jgi:hypothetical protein
VGRKQSQAMKEEQNGQLYTRWMQDQDMQPVNRLMLFEEYLEMGKEFIISSPPIFFVPFLCSHDIQLYQ